VAVAQAPPAPAATAPPASAEITAAQQTAIRLRKVWNGGDVAVLNRVAKVSATSEDTSDLLGRLNNKYGVYDRYYDATALQQRTDLAKASQFEGTVSGASSEQEDYRTVYNNANKKTFDATQDNPDNLETMLGALWGKRYGYMSEAQKADALRNEKMLIISATPASVERQSIATSSDNSVQKWVAVADDAEKLTKPPAATPPFKPKSYWYGPRVMGDAIDATHEALNGHGRAPSDPPKPPGQSYIFADLKTAQDVNNPITMIESITVTKAGTTSAQQRPPEATFTPIMTKEAILGPKSKAYIV